MNLKNMFFTGERLSIKDIGGINQARYEFASRYVKKKEVIEFGCAFGYGSFILAKKRAKSVLAVDFNEKAILYAKKNFKHKNISYVLSKIETLNYNKRFDTAIAFELIEHLQKPNVLLNLVRRSLKKGGYLIVSTPNRALSSYDGNKPSNPYHIKEYYPHEFKSLLKRYFNQVEMFGIFLKESKKINEDDVKKSLRWRISSLLTRKRWIRRLVNFIPETPKRIFTGESNLLIDAKDFRFSKKNVTSASYILGVCKL
jgi:SAM-dependent methyltransferase